MKPEIEAPVGTSKKKKKSAYQPSAGEFHFRQSPPT